jgi:hypothetical protein
MKPEISLTPLADHENLTNDHFAAVRSDGLTFLSCLLEAGKTSELIEQINRLFGTKLPLRNDTNQEPSSDEDENIFLRFVWNYVFIICPPIS